MENHGKPASMIMAYHDTTNLDFVGNIEGPFEGLEGERQLEMVFWDGMDSSYTLW